MQLKVVILFLTCFLCVSRSLKVSSNETNLLNTFEINSSEKWDKLCQHLVNMMLSSDARRKGTVDVAILFLETVSVKRKYEGFDVKLAKHANGSLVMRKANNFIPNVLDNGRESFLIFLINDLIPNYQTIIPNYFQRVFLDKSFKIFLIITDLKSRSRTLMVWNALILLKYSNVYIIFHENNGEFSIHRTMMEKTPKNALNIFLKESTDQKFLLMKDVTSTSTLPIRIIYYDTYPVSYLKKGSIIGPDGNLIYEFSKKLNTSVQIVNRPSSVPTLDDISYYLDTSAEISIYAKSALYTQNVATVWLNEVEGICLLVPRNIPVSAFENYIMPMDKPSLILALISTISVIVTWMKVTDEMSTTSILFAVYEFILNLGASGIDRLTLRENFLVYCFIFSSFILVSSYESLILSLMVTKSSMRSAHDLMELNESDTKFYSFYDRNFAKLANLPLIRNELVLNYLNYDKFTLPELPHNFDENLVYLVYCKYAEAFIHSSRNIRDKSQIFDKMIISQVSHSYTVSTGYFYIDEFKDFVGRLAVSGIYKFWERQRMEDIFDKSPKGNDKKSADDTIGFDGMHVPIIILLIGSLIALMTLLIENIVYRWKDCWTIYMNNKVAVHMMTTKRRKLKLDNWRKKFISNRTSKNNKQPGVIKSKEKNSLIKFINERNESIKCRESVGGGYFIIEKFKATNKSRQRRHRIIQVRPIEECSAES